MERTCGVHQSKAPLDRGAEVGIKDLFDSTPLHWAAYCGHVECIKALLDCGAEVDMKDIDGRTPLHNAAWKGYVECVKALLGRGADENIKDTKGQSALDRAVQRGARSRIDECEEQLTLAISRNDEHEAQLATARSRIDEYAEQLATARSRIDECDVDMACMTGQGDVLPSQDVETLERLLAKVDKECLRKAIFDKCVQRERHQALDAAAECGVCLSAPKDICLDPCGHLICRSCSNRIQVCPICRQHVAERRRVFL
eukprot:gene30655-biopygen16495